MSARLRPELEPVPQLMRKLRVARGYPVPWFVGWVNGEPEFRSADVEKLALAIRDRLCWVCGNRLAKDMTFVIGPMCGVNRTSAEPPSHLICGRWSARNCPFLSRPHAHRRDNDKPDGIVELKDGPGFAIKRNPGVTLLWTTRKYTRFSDGKGGMLFHTCEPLAVEWWAEGRPATRAQVEASITSGLPALEKLADQQAGARGMLAVKVKQLQRYLPLV